MTAYAPNGNAITGTLEIVYGCGVISPDSFDATGQFEYTGETDIWWDSQETVLVNEHDGYALSGARCFLDSEGNEYPESDLVYADEGECDCDNRSWRGDRHDSACPVTIAIGVDAERHA